MQNTAQHVLEIEGTGQAGPAMAGGAPERTGSWLKQGPLDHQIWETQKSGGLM